MEPVRLQLSRAKGFNLQALSKATNGLECVKVDRTTKWGNPFRPGTEIPFLRGRKVQDKRHAFMLYVGHAPLQERLIAAAREELRGKNLACWCPRGEGCHADVLLKLANPALRKEGG